MKRRAILKALSSGTVLLAVGGVSFVACSDNHYTPLFFQLDSYQFLSELSESILPDCEESPGAKNAGVASFLDRYIPMCTPQEFQDAIKITIEKLRMMPEENFKKSFHKLSKEAQKEQMELFEGLEDDGYRKLKSKILFAYFSSLEGMTKALSYIAVPGKYEGDIYYDNKQKGWAL